MKEFWARMGRLIPGLMLYSLGIFLNGLSTLGYAPWDVFNNGICRVLGITMGQASISIGLVVLLIDLLMREKLGLGTILNMLLIGAFLDLFTFINDFFGLLPTPGDLVGKVMLCVVALFVNAIATYLYMSAALGAGPRDSFMVAVKRRLSLPVGVCRILVEGVVFLIGWTLGGAIGIGTIIMVVGNGLVMQLIFRLFHFDVSRVKNESIVDTARNLFPKKKVGQR